MEPIMKFSLHQLVCFTFAKKIPIHMFIVYPPITYILYIDYILVDSAKLTYMIISSKFVYYYKYHITTYTTYNKYAVMVKVFGFGFGFILCCIY